MYTTETLEDRSKNGWQIVIDVVDFCEGLHWFADLYTESEHIGGETIAAPAQLCRGAVQHYRGQYTPAELASDYAKQGRENPSREAYATLQKELAHYIQASDCALKCTVSRNGIVLASGYGVMFDWSHELEQGLEDTARAMLRDYGRDFIREAIAEAREVVRGLAA